MERSNTIDTAHPTLTKVHNMAKHTPDKPLYVIDDSGKIKWTSGNSPKTSRFGCYLRLLLLGVGIFLLGRYLIIPFFETGGGSADTRPVPGDASRFDPFGALPEIRAYAGEGALLMEIEMYYVRSDGTMELTAEYSPSPRVTYDFMREVPRPDNAPPIGAGGANTEAWYEPIEIEAYQPGKWWHVTSGSSEYSYMNKGMERDTSSPRNGLPSPVLDDPQCSLVELWEQAINKDAPRDAVATITYDQNGYEFTISGLSIYLQFDMNCRLVSS